MSRRAHPDPMFLRDDFALRTREFRSFSGLDVGYQLPNALNPARLRWRAVHGAAGGDHRSGYSQQHCCGEQFVRHRPSLSLRGGGAKDSETDDVSQSVGRKAEETAPDCAAESWNYLV